MRKKTLALLALLSVLCLALSGCVTSPPDSLMRAEPADASALVDAQVDTLPGNEASAALYFRYGTSAYLAPEQRQITIEKNESPEKALVKALVAGPSASASALSPLFPPGTEVLAVSMRDEKGGLAEILKVLAEAGIALEYAYAFLLQKVGEACLIIRVPDNAAAEEALQAAGIGIATQEELF